MPGFRAAVLEPVSPRRQRPGRSSDRTLLKPQARSEGTITWYVAQMSGEAAEAMARRFTQRYPGVTVSAIRTTGQVAYERLQQERKWRATDQPAATRCRWAISAILDRFEADPAVRVIHRSALFCG